MVDSNLLYNNKVISSYWQVSLVDVEKKDSYPQWKAGDEIVVFGTHGVVVATANDQLIELFVYSGKIKPQYTLCVSGEISVGRKGILVGSEIFTNTTCLSIPSGKYSIVVYTDKLGTETKKVYFCINPIRKK